MTSSLLVIFISLAKDPENRVYMGTEELGLLPEIVNILRSPDFRFYFSFAIDVVDALSKEPTNRAYMGSKALGLVSTLQYPVLPNFTQEIKKILYQISLGPPKLDLLPTREEEPPDTY